MKKYNFWTNKEIEYLKENYGILNIKEIENYLNRSKQSIYGEARRLNLTKKPNFWTDKEIKYLEENYKYRNKEKLINNLDRTWTAIQEKAFKLNLTGIDVNEDFFKEWNKEMAWTFGLWIADGCMFGEKYGISFVSKDYNMLEIVKSNLKSEHKIGKHGDSFQLQIYNKTLYNDLLNLGGTPRKSLTIQFPKVPDELLPHFIRGYLDGDGSNFIHIDKERTKNNRYLNSSFVGNIDFLIILKEKIKEHADIETGKLTDYGKKCNPRIKQLRYNGKNAITLCDYIYQDSENLRLERKFEIYDEMRKEYIRKLEEKKLKK